ncbi:hypothetical protein [Thermogemmatispora onikobensis]|uniref:hypothetical protein n=1 Tax=Thermogemmatispora onikobensis TaxID=732234 RepID=UPI000852A1A2|nr:hypothetical protein [Thermogemmatispora onikobensis]
MDGWPVRCGCWPLLPAQLLLPALQHCCWLRPLAACPPERQARRRWLFSLADGVLPAQLQCS